VPEEGTSELLSHLDAGVLTLTLNRPEVRNALTAGMLTALAQALDEAERSSDVRVVVLAGAGQSFCAGGDVKGFARGESIFGPMSDPDIRASRQVTAQRATSVRLWHFPKPTLALLNGPAVGAGLALALACDLRYACAEATLRTGFINVGLAGDFGCSWFLNQLVGPARAKELLYLSPPLSAAEARHWGLVSEVFASDVLAAQGRDLARRLAGSSQPALRAIKENVARAHDGDLGECADAEVRWHVRLLGSPEQRAALAARTNNLSQRTHRPTGDVSP
jgi:2-(1,2-epoxy-1,2-dihydrophenyl)acetyl-CoA isomerase